MTKWFVAAAAGIAVGVCIAVVAGNKDDIIRYQRMKNM
jgi:hypothetical protein